MEGWVISAAMIVVSIISSAAVAMWRLKAAEDKQEADRKSIESRRKDDAQNLSTTLVGLNTRIDALDSWSRSQVGSLFSRSDENRQAGGILESRLGALENFFDAKTIHEHNQQKGASEARLSGVEKSVDRLETEFLSLVKSGAYNERK